MEFEEFKKYMSKLWLYLLYAYIFLTLLPKSFQKIKKIANADYEENRYKYHRCYAPEMCCHPLAMDDVTPAAKVPRTPKTELHNYPPKRSSVDYNNGYHSTASETNCYSSRRPVQTHTHVNQIARMFETDGVCSNINNHNTKKINRVTPIILPSTKRDFFSPSPLKKTKSLPMQRTVNTQRRSSAEKFAEMLLAENLISFDDFEFFENSNSMECRKSPESDVSAKILTVPSYSATPSTASPSASCSSSPSPSPCQLSPAPLLMKINRSSIEDIFAIIASNAEKIEPQFSGTLSPVTSIDDILAERRLSRPLSAYSISELLFNEENSQISTSKT